MATVTFILGLCGSGKTWLADHLIIADKIFDEGFFDDRGQHADLIASLRGGQDCVVIEITYCCERARTLIVNEVRTAVPDVKINWLCIENDLSKANKNCRKRTNKNDPGGSTHVEINGRLSPTYTYPPGAVILKMWNGVS
jgi:hypothetical protein